MGDIAQFNQCYLEALRRSAVANPKQTVSSFGIGRDIVDMMAEASISDVASLISDDCTLVRQCFSLAQIALLDTILDITALGDIHQLNYEYLMLIRHLAVHNPREAMLRTGAEYAVAIRLSKMTSRQIHLIAQRSVGMLGKCHLTLRAVKVALNYGNELPNASMLAMMSIRRDMSWQLAA